MKCPPWCPILSLRTLLQSYVRIIRIRGPILLSIYLLLTIRTSRTLRRTSESPDITAMIAFDIVSWKPGLLFQNVHSGLAIWTPGDSQETCIVPWVPTFAACQWNSIVWIPGSSSKLFLKFLELCFHLVFLLGFVSIYKRLRRQLKSGSLDCNFLESPLDLWIFEPDLVIMERWRER